MAMKCISSTDAKTWAAPDGAGNPTNHGPSLVVYRGELWGSWLTFQQNYENVMFLFKYSNGKMPAWGGNINVPSAWRGLGRTSVTTIDDKFYLGYRGTSGKYWVGMSSTPSDTTSWTLAGPGAVDGALWAYSPAVCAFQGSIFVFGATEKNDIYYAKLSSTGVVEKAWTPLSTSSQTIRTVQSPAAVVYRGELYLFYTAENSQEFWYSKLSSKDGSWPAFSPSYKSVAIGSSPSCAVHSDGKLYVSWSAQSDGSLYYFTLNGSTVDMSTQVNSTARAAGAVGCGSHNGNLYLTYGQKSTTSTLSAKHLGEGYVVEHDDSDDDSIYNEKYSVQRPSGPDPAGAFRIEPATSKSEKSYKKWLRKVLCY